MIGIEKRQLENGLTCLYVPLSTAGSATSNITYRIGSANENVKEFGFAHMFEHSLFFGSKNFKGDMNITELEMDGAILNATTSIYRTNFFEVVTMDELFECIAREADRGAGNPDRGLDEEVFKQRLKNEIIVVLNEMEIGNNNPMSKLHAMLNSVAFLVAPNRHATIGLRDNLLKATPEMLLDYHRRSYTPNNATYTFVGPFDARFIDQLHARVEAEFGPAVPNESRVEYDEEPEQEGMRRFVIDGPQMMAMGFRGPKGLSRSAYALEMLKVIFNYDFAEFVQKGYALQMMADWNRYQQSSLFTLWVVGDCEHLIWDYLKHKRITGREVEYARSELEHAWGEEMQSSQGVAMAINEAIARGDYNDVNTRFKVIGELSAVDLQAAMRYLTDNRCTVGIMRPQKVETFVEVRESSLVPSVQYASPYPSDPDYVTENGTYFVGSSNYAYVKYDFSNKPSQLFALTMNAYGLDGVEWFASPGNVMALYRKVPEIVLDRRKLARCLEIAVSMYTGQMVDPASRGMYELRKELFGELRFETSVEDVERYVHELGKGTVTAVGKTPDVLQEFRVLEGAIRPYVPSRSRVKNTNIYVKLDKVSVTVLMGASTGIGRDSESYLPLYIACSILGYGFHGLLMRDVRMDKGLTYGAYARLEPYLFYASATFAQDNVERGMMEMKSTIGRWSDAITDTEVEIQKRRLLQLPVVLADDPKVLVKAHHTFFRPDAVRSVTAGQVRDSLKNLGTMITVVAG